MASLISGSREITQKVLVVFRVAFIEFLECHHSTKVIWSPTSLDSFGPRGFVTVLIQEWLRFVDSSGFWRLCYGFEAFLGNERIGTLNFASCSFLYFNRRSEQTRNFSKTTHNRVCDTAIAHHKQQGCIDHDRKSRASFLSR